MLVGLGYRRPLANWIQSHSQQVDCLEITAEHFYAGGEKSLASLAKTFPLFVHGLGLSLGTPGPLDKNRLNQFAAVCKIANPQWISEHVAFTRSEETDLGHLNPVPLTHEACQLIADHAREVSDTCGKPIILENITSHIAIEGELSETDFLNELCTAADCGILLDVTNLFVNSRNHNFDPITWLNQIEPTRIIQLHIVGYSRDGTRYTDDHGEPVQLELLQLAQATCTYANPRAIILERDTNFPENTQLRTELDKLRGLRANH